MEVSDLERSEAKSLTWKGRVGRSVVNYLIFLAKRLIRKFSISN